MRNFAQKAPSLAPPITSSVVVLDNASGPGIVTEEVVRNVSREKSEICATDLAPAMVRTVQNKNWSDVHAQPMNSQALTFPDNKLTPSLINFAIMAMLELTKAAAHIYWTLQPEGITAIATWKRIGYMVIFHAVQKAAKPDARFQNPIPPISPEWLTDAKLREVLIGAGFESAKVEIVHHSERISTKI